jgi:hypothetical protein
MPQKDTPFSSVIRGMFSADKGHELILALRL